MSAIRKSTWIISSNKASVPTKLSVLHIYTWIHVNAKLFFSSWRTMFVWNGNFQGHVCAGRFTRPCIVHTEFWRLVATNCMCRPYIKQTTKQILYYPQTLYSLQGVKTSNKYFIIPRHYTVYKGSKHQTNALLSPDTILCTRGQNIKQIHRNRRQ